jgi:thiol-disulfide isomerase/thioredoxin
MQPSTQNPAHGLRLRLWLLALALSFCFAHQALASHEANEPSDGTVNSFRWLQKPLLLPETPLRRWQLEPASLSQFKGKVVLLNIWATWCPPCVYELPALDRLQQRLGNEDFVVVTVSVDHDPGPAHDLFTGRLALANLDFYFELPERLGKTFPLDVLPTNFIIDREGRAIGMLRSYVDWDSPAADEFVKRLLAGSLPPKLQNQAN